MLIRKTLIFHSFSSACPYHFLESTVETHVKAHTSSAPSTVQSSHLMQDINDYCSLYILKSFMPLITISTLI